MWLRRRTFGAWIWWGDFFGAAAAEENLPQSWVVVNDAKTSWEKADDPVKDGGGDGEEEEVLTKRQQERQERVIFKKEARWQQANDEGGIVSKTPAEETTDHPKTAPAQWQPAQ